MGSIVGAVLVKLAAAISAQVSGVVIPPVPSSTGGHPGSLVLALMRCTRKYLFEATTETKRFSFLATRTSPSKLALYRRTHNFTNCSVSAKSTGDTSIAIRSTILTTKCSGDVDRQE